MGRAVIINIVGAALLLTGLAPGDVARAMQEQTPKKQNDSKEKTAEFASPELAVLDRFAGPWNVSEAHYNSRGDVVGSAKGIEEGAWVLDRRSLRRTYTSGEEGNLFRAIGMMTWDAVEKHYEGAWFDNASTSGPTALTGVWDEASRTMTFTLISTGTDGKPLQHKVIDRFLDDEHRVATTYKVVGNQVEKVIEVQFTRARPCPSNMSIVPEIPSPKKP
jgi:hypothetical protein